MNGIVARKTGIHRTRRVEGRLVAMGELVATGAGRGHDG